ncbi:hypothetical protein QYE76_036770 [Lolium multiflorum]|uniref:Ubiquitin-like domain-containing protein n=1 Tax=Lolium multiflorum TaxID=4521 RepID=A0AAD8VMD3_LOLMU|nr:hypothetical protein QYE76_036770 [Lolium multiflorum]
MKVFVAVSTRPNHAPVALEVSKDDTLASVKAKLHDMVGIPPPRQRLVFAFSALPDNDDTSLADHGVTDLSTFQLVMIMKMQVFVRCMYSTRGGTITISDVEFSDTVESFRLKVQLKAQQQYGIGIRPAQQRLSYGGKQLEDGHILMDYNIQEYATIQLLCRPCRLRTRVVELDIEVTDTVGRIKERVEEAERVPVACQRVYYCGNELDDSRALADYGALASSTPVKIGCERQEGDAPVVVENETTVNKRTDIDITKNKRKTIKTKPLAETEVAEVPSVKRRRFPFYLIGPELGEICPSSCDTDPAY